jgi:hypothetical protein
MESAHAKQPNNKVMIPAFHFFLCRNQAPVKIKMVMKIPGGSRKGVNIFLSINICPIPLLIRALMFRQDHRIKKDIFAFPVYGSTLRPGSRKKNKVDPINSVHDWFIS